MIEKKIISIKLSNGDELLSKFVSETDHELVVENVFSLAVTPQGLGMSPFMYTIGLNRELKLNKQNVISVVETDQEHRDNYLDLLSKIPQ